MIHIKPVKNGFTDLRVAPIYQDILFLLRLKVVPPYFQYIAAFPSFLELLWTRLRPVIDSPQFQNAVIKLGNETRHSLSLETPTSPTLSLLTAKLSDSTKKDMYSEFLELERIQTTLLLLSMLVRETIKGLKLKVTHPLPLAESNSRSTALSPNGFDTEKELGGFDDSALSFPRLGSDPAVVAYMHLVSQLMEDFSKSKEYLNLRVTLEQTAQGEMKKLWPDFLLHYQEVVTPLESEMYSDELIYLLHDAFPAYFPKQLLSSLLLELNLLSKDDPQPLIPLTAGNELSPRLSPSSS